MTQEQLDVLEEYAFYESGLSAHDCLAGLDDRTKKAIQKYGRIIIRVLEKELDIFQDKDTSEVK